MKNWIVVSRHASDRKSKGTIIYQGMSERMAKLKAQDLNGSSAGINYWPMPEKAYNTPFAE